MPTGLRERQQPTPDPVRQTRCRPYRAVSDDDRVEAVPLSLAEVVSLDDIPARLILGILVFGGVGTLIVGRFPENLLGWAFCGMALAFPVSLVIYLHCYTGLIGDPGSLPGADVLG